MSEALRTLHEYDTSERFVARVLSNESITPPGAEAEVRELVLEVQRPDFPYEVGQSVGVITPGAKRSPRSIACSATSRFTAGATPKAAPAA